MDNYNVHQIENKWQIFFDKNKISKNQSKKKNFTVLKCFHIPQEKFIWDTLETIHWVMF